MTITQFQEDMLVLCGLKKPGLYIKSLYITVDELPVATAEVYDEKTGQIDKRMYEYTNDGFVDIGPAR